MLAQKSLGHIKSLTSMLRIELMKEPSLKMAIDKQAAHLPYNVATNLGELTRYSCESVKYV